MNMRLLGAPTISDVKPDMVDTANINQHIVSVPTDRLYDANCMYPSLLISSFIQYVNDVLYVL